MKNLVRVRVLACVAALCVVALPALADPPTMPTVTYPIDTASIVTAITAAGVTVLLLSFGIHVAFGFAKKLFRRVKSAV